ncbi:hypothetical protein BAE44_0011832 [Dichanthelium oligosanthes]|uniref:Uncharacterized protein n=1 Tax=Dichanthelium oligosanthes TaxID=888268 RepID=A0A1E5VPX3_9POAL|nr:hypothetical protein BAE44_0011832 [Dichanthelium oligosanthes]
MPSPNHHCCFLPVCCPSFSAAGDPSPAAAASTGRLCWVARKKRKRLKLHPRCERSGASVL